MRPLLVLGLVATMSGLASSAAARSETPIAHDHATHDHAVVPATELEPLAEAPRAGPECSATAGLKLPDLRMAKVDDLTIRDPRPPAEGEPDPWPAGTKLLRFTTVVMNIGVGPFEVKGALLPNDPPTMSTNQKLYRTAQPTNVAADCLLRATPAIAQYSGDGHNHWHIQKMQRFQLFSREPGGEEIRLRGFKTGFCFFDGLSMRENLPGYQPSTRYSFLGCGNETSSSIKMGLSIGWGDIYPWDIAHQWIDITGVSDGDYRLCVTVNGGAQYLESSRTNNQVYSDITISGMATGSPTATTIARVWGACS
jgi:hypothetical protein